MRLGKKQFQGFTLVEVPALSGRKRAAFTLVELLVVIGIIAVLIAILLPTLQRARQSAEQAACMSNLHQFAIVMAMYADDNHNFCFPCEFSAQTVNTAPMASETPLKSILKTYIPVSVLNNNNIANKAGTVYTCPSSLLSVGSASNAIVTYACNKSVHSQYSYDNTTHLPNNPLRQITKIHRTTEIVSMGDVSQPANGSVNYDVPGWYDYTDPFGVREMTDPSLANQLTNTINGWSGNSDVSVFYHPRYRHGGNRSANFLFVDGHCENVLIKVLKMKNFATAY